MNKTKTTYGVYGLVEWQAGLKAGKATAKVAFTGGSITTQGVIPATFTTGDPVIQFVIEGSPEFKSGKIKVVRRVKIDGEVKIQRNPKVDSMRNAQCIMHNESNPDLSGISENNQGNHDLARVDDLSGEAGEQEAEVRADEGKPEEVEADNEQQSDTETTDASDDKALVDVEFACNDDAKDYLEQQFGVTRSKLHNRAEIVAAGKANGVNIIFS